jgi:hypothetical protein
VGKTDALGERRPVEVIGWGQKLHCSIPVSPPALNLSVALGVMAAGCGASRSGRCSEVSEEFGHELLRLIAMDDVGSTAAKENFVK